MPGLFDKTIGRRAFLKHCAAGAATLAFTAVAQDSQPSTKNSSTVHLALLSDTHVPADQEEQYRGFYPSKNLEQIVSQVVAAGPEAALISGDLARLTGQPGDYQRLHSILSPLSSRLPVVLGLGNHDHHENFKKAFPESPGVNAQVNAKHVLIMEWNQLRLIMLDSLLSTNLTAGFLGKAQRTWLDQYLARVDDRPVVLVVHHTLTDGDGDLLDVDRLFSLVRPHSKVKAIFYGHSHEYGYGQEGRVHLVNIPSTAYNFRDVSPLGWLEAHFNPKGVDLTLRALAGNRSQDGRTTSLVWL